MANYRYTIVNKQIMFYEINDDVTDIVKVINGRADYLVHL